MASRRKIAGLEIISVHYHHAHGTVLYSLHYSAALTTSIDPPIQRLHFREKGKAKKKTASLCSALVKWI